jgi:hypothetical protein
MSFYTARVITGHSAILAQRPLYPRKRTSTDPAGMSASVNLHNPGVNRVAS